MQTDTILQGDIRKIARTLPDRSIHEIVCSPPYYGLRDYGVEGQIGLEETPQEYVETLVSIFRELRRVLRDDGSLWLNLGDSYAGSGKGRNADGTHQEGGKQGTNRGTIEGELFKTDTNGLKPKDLIGIPWRVALALQADGWYLRSDIIWSKPSPMPESVTDRPTKAHEYIFLLSKSPRYYYDQEAVREPAVRPGDIQTFGGEKARNGNIEPDDPRYRNGSEQWGRTIQSGLNGRNRRTVWTVASKPYPEAHFATFPPDLIRPCILAGCPAKCCADCGAPWVRVVEVERIQTRPGKDESSKYGGLETDIRSTGPGNVKFGLKKRILPITKTTGFRPTCACDAPTVPGIVFDPFMGSGTVAQVAIEEGRRWLGCELNQEYIDLAWERINKAKLAKIAGNGYAKQMTKESDGYKQLGLINAG